MAISLGFPSSATAVIMTGVAQRAPVFAVRASRFAWDDRPSPNVLAEPPEHGTHVPIARALGKCHRPRPWVAGFAVAPHEVTRAG